MAENIRSQKQPLIELDTGRVTSSWYRLLQDLVDQRDSQASQINTLQSTVEQLETRIAALEAP